MALLWNRMDFWIENIIYCGEDLKYYFAITFTLMKIHVIKDSKLLRNDSNLKNLVFKSKNSARVHSMLSFVYFPHSQRLEKM